MKRTETEDDGSFSYLFTREEIQKLIMKEHRELIDYEHKVIRVDLGDDDVALMIQLRGCGELIYENDTIKCGEWSGGDRHFCKKCFANSEQSVVEERK